MKTKFDETTKSSNEARLLLADGVLKNAIELLPASTYEPNHIGYFVKQDDEDMGNEDYCEKCIDDAVKSAKKYNKKSKFSSEGHDPDFSGGETEPKSCEGCGHYFYTNFEPDEDCANRLLKDLNDGDLLNDDYKESLKWKLEIAFGNYDYCDLEVKEILVKCAEIVIKNYTMDGKVQTRLRFKTEIKKHRPKIN